MKRILCCGKIVDAGPIAWNIAPLPVDEADAAFDAPSTISYFAHLMPEPADESIQDIMDIANADMLAEEYEDYFLDQAWMNAGLS